MLSRSKKMMSAITPTEPRIMAHVFIHRFLFLIEAPLWEFFYP